MPPRNIAPISAPDTPDPWLNASASTSRAARTEEAKAKAREEQQSATMKDHVIEMLGEFNNLPVSTPADPEHRDDSVSDSQQHGRRTMTSNDEGSCERDAR